jgi:biopolymer transport protein ExbD
MNASQVRARARKAAQRREEDIEAEEIEGGEINLVPYLDIVTNLLLFALVSVAASFVVGEINTTLPNVKPPSDDIKPPDPNKDPNEERLQLVVSATARGITVWSLTGLEGTISDPKAQIAVLATDPIIQYDYPRLNDTLYEIASRRWKDKRRAMQTYEIVLQADPKTPYATIIKIMDNMRRRIPPGANPNEPLEPVSLPDFQAAADGQPEVIKEPYDPDEHWLFPDILFSIGFQ